CRVKNNTDDLATYVELKGTFYDENGKIVGTAMGNATNLASNAEKTIDVLGLDIDNAAKYEIQVNNVMFE
ncbi:MAG: FxLYD domain-containing protein, partial [Salibacter sp.]|uniref:FxLYD domain-containing protein n=1 Tax=Salibacter sp. TaxID=2010995 RepID=UPI00287045B0